MIFYKHEWLSGVTSTLSRDRNGGSNEMTLLRRCSKCHIEKIASPEFFPEQKFRSGNIGFSPKCRACVRADNARWYANNTERSLAKSQKWRTENPEKSKEIGQRAYSANREAYLERSRIWHQVNRDHKRQLSKALILANLDSHRAYGRSYYQKNNEILKSRAKSYRSANPEKTRLLARISSAKRRSRLSGKFDISDVNLKYEQQKGKCYWCKSALNNKYHIDHIIAISKGGLNTASNICCACSNCNLKKYNRTPWDFSGRLL